MSKAKKSMKKNNTKGMKWSLFCINPRRYPHPHVADIVLLCGWHFFINYIPRKFNFINFIGLYKFYQVLMQCIETSLGKFTHFAEDLLARASHETIELPATPCNTRVRTRGLKMLVFRKILRTYLIDDPYFVISSFWYHKV